MRVLATLALLCCACSVPAGSPGPVGLAGQQGLTGAMGPQGPAGPRGAAAGGAFLQDGQNTNLGTFLSSGEIYIPSVGCTLQLQGVGGATGGLYFYGTQLHDAEIIFTSNNCTGTPYTPDSVVRITCRMYQPPFGSIIGQGIGPSVGSPRAQAPSNGPAFRFFRTHQPIQWVFITPASAFLANGNCAPLSPNQAYVIQLEEIPVPDPVPPLSIVTVTP